MSNLVGAVCGYGWGLEMLFLPCLFLYVRLVYYYSLNSSLMISKMQEVLYSMGEVSPGAVF